MLLDAMMMEARKGLMGRERDQFPVGMRVLAVDDDPVCLKVLEALLRRCQYYVITTNQAITALKLLRENKDMFDLVISDVHMPDMDGFKLLELVGLEMDLPVITMSSSPPDEVLARKGRLKQRYDNEYRLVSGCVPYRVKKDQGNPCSLADDRGQVEVLMISTPNRADMVFPKGGWEDDEDVYQAACREAMEEAGVKGIIDRTTLGHWVFKSKSSQTSSSPRGACKGYIFAMEVIEELESWPEQATHGRRWVSPGEAYQLCRYDWMREALTALLERFSIIEAVESTQELTDQNGMYMMLQTTSDGVVALC